ncbi:MAG: PDZ domain-containing protein [Acidimicrobiales bacterium]
MITAVDGKAVDGAAALSSAVKANEPGDRVRLQVLRGPADMTLEATLTTQPGR